MPGCEPDTMETLEADGLIEWLDDDTILVMQRDDRVSLPGKLGSTNISAQPVNRQPSTKCPNRLLTRLASRAARGHLSRVGLKAPVVVLIYVNAK